MRINAKQAAGDSQAFAQLNLVHEDITDLLRSLVNSLGGPKAVAERLYPQKAPEAGRRYLLDCLNPDRSHDLGVEGLFTLLKWAREKGVHFGMAWMSEQLGYATPIPVEPEDQRAELQRQFNDGVARLEQLAKRLQR